MCGRLERILNMGLEGAPLSSFFPPTHPYPGTSPSHWNAWTLGSVGLGLCTQVVGPLSILTLSICEMGMVAVPTSGR